MDTQHIFDWQASLVQTYESFATQLIHFAPNFIGAIILMAIGWGIAHILKLMSRKLVNGLDFLFKQTAKTEGIKQRERIKYSYAAITSTIVFWIVILFFITASANLLGWTMFSGWMDTIISYLPSLVTGIVIILTGFLLGNGAKVAVEQAANAAGLEHQTLLSRTVQFIIVFTTIVIGIEQIGINIHFLTNSLVVIIGVLLAGASLAFGLGAKNLIANVIGAQYTRKHCHIGEKLRCGEFEGSILEVTQTTIVLDTAKGRATLPAKMFLETYCELSSHQEDTHTN